MSPDDSLRAPHSSASVPRPDAESIRPSGPPREELRTRTDDSRESPFFDPLADEAAPDAEAANQAKAERRQFISFKSPREILCYEPPPGSILAGSHHICLGGVFVIGGAPGVGKSRASTALAVAGATGRPWFGLEIHRPFKTMILQAENGELRLKNEYEDLDCDALDAYVRVSPPPPHGIRIENTFFQKALKAEIEEFAPDVVLIDPWNSIAKDSMEKDYQEAFDNLRQVIPVGPKSPAIGIIAHTRKPRVGEKASGRALLNLLAGSYVLASVPRAVFVIQPASDDTEDDRVVFTPCKNNDGDLGRRSAWRRRNGLFVEVEEFDWKEFDGAGGNGGGGKPKAVTEADIKELFGFGRITWRRSEAAKRLQVLAGCGRTKAYDSLNPFGEFKHLIDEDGNGVMRLRAAASATSDRAE